MQSKTHLLTTFAIVTPVAYMTNNMDMLGVFGLALGTVLPDIDEPNSYIGRRIPILPHIIKKTFGHRGMTHTLIATILFATLASMIPNSFTEMLATGYFLHIAEDTFSMTGIKWLAPFSQKTLAFKLYSTGKMSETIIMFLMLICLCLEYWFILAQPFINV
ncbi:metal-dependent hydrolase [Listeria monocytogenes]|nr:metal-dependent hydrolase [Listeria monocytogenes]